MVDSIGDEGSKLRGLQDLAAEHVCMHIGVMLALTRKGVLLWQDGACEALTRKGVLLFLGTSHWNYLHEPTPGFTKRLVD